MIESLTVIVAGLLVIAAAAEVGPRLGVASPLVLIAMGVAASFLPVFHAVEIDPEWILEGVLPPLLYASAVSMPAMNFRREFGAISGLSVVLVIASSLLLGVFFMLAVPELGFAWGVALGAIVSPTDAVATSIVKQASVSKRVVAMLDGESLLNDATALVLLRTAIAATAASFSVWSAIGTFAYSVVVAVIVGLLVGRLNLIVRRRVSDPTVNTIISFAVPFIASVPAVLLHGSGLVAAVIAGLVTGMRAPRDLSPQHRRSDSQNWRTVELVLEGAVFLTMGLQIRSILTDVHEEHAGAGQAVLIAAGALILTILVRAAYVTPLLGVLAVRARHAQQMHTRMLGLQEQMSTPAGQQEAFEETTSRRRPASQRELTWFAYQVRQRLGDIDYFLRQPLGWREGATVVWAGMRGAVTLAAAQTLPEDTPQRPVLVLIAFTVAALSLVLQGGTIGPLLALTSPAAPEAGGQQTAAEAKRLRELLNASAQAVPHPRAAGIPGPHALLVARNHQLAVITAQRSALLDARDYGTFDAETLSEALAALDATQIAAEMHLTPQQ